MKKDKKKKGNWLRRKTRVVGLNPSNYKELWSFRINRIQFLSTVVLFIFIFIGISYILFAYTPVWNILPDEIKNKNKYQLEKLAHTVEQQNQQIETILHYNENLRKVIKGTLPIDSIYTHPKDTTLTPIEIDTITSTAEKKLNQSIDKQINAAKNITSQTLNQLFLFDPVEGEISQQFNIPNHPGVDIITKNNEKIKACLDGIVVSTSNDKQDGKTIVISHQNTITSVYKHAKTLFVKVGDKVKTGESIGIVGNSGERTTGPHLHFELWNSKGPINPLSYFSFDK